MKFLVLGSGAWGTAFALHLTRLGHEVQLAPRRPEQAAALRAARENADYLPGVALPETLRIDSDLAASLAGGCDAVLLACPSQALRETSVRLRSALSACPRQPWVLSLAKGLEVGSHLRPTQVISSELPGVAVGGVTGPTNASEVARGLPGAMVLASDRVDEGLAALQSAMSGPTLRLYTSDDVAGIEFGGCLKNIYAIAAGCCDGLRLGDNSKAALLTRALAEMVRVGTALGARAETFYGLSGFGDLVATCHGAWSRNRQFGQSLGEGASAASLLQGRRTVVEGYRTTESFHGLCLERGIDAPILAETHAICFQGKLPAEALYSLMSRGLKRE